MSDLDCIHTGGDSLGESPLWNPDSQKLFWIDINNCLIHRFSPSTKNITTWTCPSEPGFITSASGGRLIAGLRTGLHFFTPSTGTFQIILDPEPNNKQNRLNDGKIDRKGRLWCGSMHNTNHDQRSGALYRFNSDGSFNRVINNIQVPNSIAWSPDASTMYFADTREHIIWSFDVDINSGDICNRRIFVDLKESGGRPDGATVDREGYLWSANYGGSKVVRYSPDGQQTMEVVLPVTNVTSCAFGGTEYKTLYITTARQNLTANDMEKQPLAGGLFACKLEVVGLPETICTNDF